MKDKLRACKMCKPHKRGWSGRWKPKELAQLREAERMMRNIVQRRRSR